MNRTRLLPIFALLVGCTISTTTFQETVIDWVEPPPVIISSDVDIPVTVAVAGGVDVSHVNVHWSTSSDPRTDPDEETQALAGPPGQFSFVLNLHADVDTTFFITAHARVNGFSHFTDVMSVTVKPPPVFVSWTSLPPDPMDAGVDHPVEFTVSGGASVDSVRVQWSASFNPSSFPLDNTTAQSGVPGLFSDTLNIDPPQDRNFLFVVQAVVDGEPYFSPVISRLVALDPPVDVFEPNDSFTDAHFLGGSGTLSSQDAFIYPSGDSDYFWVSSGGGILSIDLTSLPQDYDLILYDANFDLVDFSTQFGTTDEAISIDLASGTYYIIVRGFNETFDTNSYTLAVDVP